VTSLPPGRRFDWSNLGVRVLSAAVLVPAVVFAVWTGAGLYLVLIAVAVALLALEWGGMSAPRAPLRVAATVTASVLAGVFLAYVNHYLLAIVIAAIGALAAALVARRVSERPADAALGVVYIGLPCLCLVWLRAMPQGAWWTFMLLAVTWAADIAAYGVGNALKGPKLWPRFSPNKTWSGFLGVLAAAMIAAPGLVAITRMTAKEGWIATAPFQLHLAAAVVIGLTGGLATMGGDLVESMLKRRFGVKDSGDLIPGHGGLLDRVDGLMFAVLAIALARMVNHLGWDH
jgi:phosphatidate cytidylyltransferase